MDNVKPVLVTNSPAIPLVVKGGVNVTFSADITDGGSGYTDDGSGGQHCRAPTDPLPGALGRLWGSCD